MEKEFSKLREKTGLPYVVFHSLRHSSTTYKLKLNHGDLKATQGDTGTDLTNLIAALEQSPELVAMLTQALKGKAISS